MLTDNIDIMEIKQVLEQLGLKDKKADVYLSALELGSATVIEIAKKAGIKRTTCYDILFDLIKSGLVFETSKGKKRLFIGEDPEKIKKDLENKEKLFSDILPHLKSIYNVSGVKPKIRFYEGKEGLKEVYDDILKYSGELLAFASEDVLRILGKEWLEGYVKRRVEKNISVRAIVPEAEMIRDFISKRETLSTIKFINREKYPFSIEINIYGHQKVALMSSKEGVGLIIEGGEIYKTMKSIFELLWDNLPEIKI